MTLSLKSFAAAADLSHADALELAQREGWTLNTYNNPVDDGRENVSIEYAVDVAQDDPSLIYLSRPDSHGFSEEERLLGM